MQCVPTLYLVRRQAKVDDNVNQEDGEGTVKVRPTGRVADGAVTGAVVCRRAAPRWWAPSDPCYDSRS